MSALWMIFAWLLAALLVSCLALGVVRAGIKAYFKEKRAHLKELMGARDADE
jgi:hypothetical protein